MADDPHKLFDTWFAEAAAAEPNDHDAMALATADPFGRPSARMVLLKGHGPRGFVFYTHRDSRKGGELEANPAAALLFHWKSLRRQIRIEGAVEPVSDQPHGIGTDVDDGGAQKGAVFRQGRTNGAFPHDRRLAACL